MHPTGGERRTSLKKGERVTQAVPVKEGDRPGGGTQPRSTLVKTAGDSARLILPAVTQTTAHSVRTRLGIALGDGSMNLPASADGRRVSMVEIGSGVVGAEG
ncbi:hypothetical protein GCM10009765_03530 [Fodinicola feengrottensis]|uniref:Uncharacterized protein n=1 Tax=Fodinicola feengrottensis TaxID=435914 RepID=A0ABN2FRE5_9ACTN